MTAQRRRFKQSTPLKERLASFANDARDQAERLRPGPEKEALIKKVRQADLAARLDDDWASSTGQSR